jgi:hypothetical protein
MTLKPQQNQSQLSISATAVFDIDAAADGSSAAALPKFRMVAYTGGPMRVAGWRYPVIIDLAGLSVPSQARPIRFGHDPLSGVGHTDAIRVEGGQLIATGIVSRDTPAAREVVVSSKNGFPWQASVGAGVDEFEFVKEGQKVTVKLGEDFEVRQSTPLMHPQRIRLRLADRWTPDRYIPYGTIAHGETILRCERS